MLTTHERASNHFLHDFIGTTVDTLDARIDIGPRHRILNHIAIAAMQLQIEREALKKEKDRPSQDRLVKLQVELGDLREKANALSARGGPAALTKGSRTSCAAMTIFPPRWCCWNSG